MTVLATDTKLTILDASKPHPFAVPIKRINDGPQVSAFLASRAYHDILTFLMQLNGAMFPRHMQDSNEALARVQIWELDSPHVSFSATVKRLSQLLDDLDKIIDEVPPDPGPRRFGNASFRKWNEIVVSRAPALLQLHLPADVLARQSATVATARSELESYLLGAFGSAQRLDYGTGHELSFLAFLGCVWKLGGFKSTKSGDEERGIVLGIIEPYLRLIRRLIKTYTLEPAGSHGVWGLDDHSFLPYVFGSAQYAPAINHTNQLPSEGSRADAPKPADVVKAFTVERERKKNMYFGAIGFIYDVKKGPFWEHSPMLFDISGVTAGWAKINKGMIKMYNAEVLSKFPVVQHFQFGSLFSWEPQPNASPPPTSIHTSSQPSKEDVISSSTSMSSTPQIRSQETSHTSTPEPSQSSSKTSIPSHQSSAAHESSNSNSNSKISIPGLALEVTKTNAVPGYSQEVSKAPWATQLPAIPVASLDTTAPWANQPLVEAETSSAKGGGGGEDTSAAGYQPPTAEAAAVTDHAAGSMGPPPPASSHAP